MKMLRAHAQEAAAVFLRAMRYQSINNACYATTMLIGHACCDEYTSVANKRIRRRNCFHEGGKAFVQECCNQEVRLF